MRPADFWRLHPVELHWLFEAATPPKMYGKLTEDQVAAEYERIYGKKK